MNDNVFVVNRLFSIVSGNDRITTDAHSRQLQNRPNETIGISLFTYGTKWKNGKKIPCSPK
ncbi:MAG: hypothetical protein ABIT05_06690 [Chitinophagaceae bacterium]